MSTPRDTGTTSISLLGEVVGGHDIRWHGKQSDLLGPIALQEPYCTIQIGKRLIHQTKQAEGDGNPIWTVATNAFFLVETTPHIIATETITAALWFKRKDALQLTVLDTMCLGRATVPLADVFRLHKLEDRIDLPLVFDATTTTPIPSGTLTLRFRLATLSDRHYLATLTSEPMLLANISANTSADIGANTGANTSMLITETNETQVAGSSFMNVVSSALMTRSYVDPKTKQEMILVKPHPDPDRVKETTYLPRSEIHSILTGPSREWIKAGSGTVGKVYVELLSCHGLPNMDVAGAAGNLTDAFVAIVYEDAMVQSPVIDDELSPKWMPWTRRAFVFGMIHPSSTLYVAVFDYDLGISNHDPIGRVAVNVANLQRDTDYTLDYNLYPSSNVTDRTSAGSIKLRVRVEYTDQKRALLEALKPRPTFHINVRKEKSLSVLRYTCYGEYGDNNEQPFDLTVVRSYINEILEYKQSLSYCLGDAFRSLIFWRGQVRVGVDLLIPLHSFLFFCMTTTLVERPYLFPSFCLLSVAWIMIAAQTQRKQHPSPWHQSFSLRCYLDILRNGKSTPAFTTIRPHEGAKEAQAYEQAWEMRLANDLELAAHQAAMQQEILDIGDEAIHTKITSAIPLDLLERLTRYQAIVGRICQRFRFIKIIVTWEESFVSFWLTACVLATGLVSLLLPWSFLLLWTGRIVTYGVFGPHMMLVDRLLSSDNGAGESALEKTMVKFKEDAFGARIRRQEALKLRDLKCLAFGKFITLVPMHNLSRHFDRPLPTSHAVLCSRPETPLSSLEVPGQHLFGKVLPRTESETLHHDNELTRLDEAQVKLKTYLEEHGQESKASLSTSLVEKDTAVSCDQSNVLSILSIDSNAKPRPLPSSTRADPNTPSITSPALNVPTRAAQQFDTTIFETTTGLSKKKGNATLFVSSSAGHAKKPSKKRVQALLADLREENPSFDEARESGEVEIVLSTSSLEREEANSRSDDGDNDGEEESRQEATDWRVLFFQPST